MASTFQIVLFFFFLSYFFYPLDPHESLNVSLTKSSCRAQLTSEPHAIYQNALVFSIFFDIFQFTLHRGHTGYRANQQISLQLSLSLSLSLSPESAVSFGQLFGGPTG
jgi:hypothetical protein